MAALALLENIANRAMRRQRVLWTVISFFFFLRLLGTFAAPLPRSQPALYTAMPHI